MSLQDRAKKKVKKEATKKVVAAIGWQYIAAIIAIVTALIIAMVFIIGIFGIASDPSASCDYSTEVVKNQDGTEAEPNSNSNTSSAFTSIDSFVKEHQDAYIKSWEVGGFLPSASITQTMIETSYSNNVPSFGQAHNMGGVKWSGASSYPKTLELYGDGAVSASGPGTSVGDGTGGGYAYFDSFDSGIVGKAEFMSRQSLYKGAINNTDGVATLSAIADGGWATDPTYKTKLIQLYHSLGEKYKWLDEKAISEYGEHPVSANSSSSESSDSDSDTESDSGKSESPIDIDGAIEWFKDKEGKVSYSMNSRKGPKSYDCSSAIYYALTENGAKKAGGDYPVSTETEHDWLLENGYEKVYEGSWSDNGEVDDLKKGDIAIWGAKGNSASSAGHTMLFMSDTDIIHCSYGNDGIKVNNYVNYKSKVPDHKKVYIYRLKDGGGSSSSEDNLCGYEDEDSTGGGGASDGTGKVPSDAKAWGYKPDELPDSLKEFIIDPAKNGLTYGGDGWVENSGQCVDLTESLGNKLWNHSGITKGNGVDQVYGWAGNFGNDVKHAPKRGAIFSTGVGQPGHTGIVCHVFEDGSVLIVEQNTPLSGITFYGHPNTWNYRLFSVSQQKADNMKFAYPDDKEPKINN